MSLLKCLLPSTKEVLGEPHVDILQVTFYLIPVFYKWVISESKTAHMMFRAFFFSLYYLCSWYVFSWFSVLILFPQWILLPIVQMSFYRRKLSSGSCLLTLHITIGRFIFAFNVICLDFLFLVTSFSIFIAKLFSFFFLCACCFYSLLFWLFFEGPFMELQFSLG